MGWTAASGVVIDTGAQSAFLDDLADRLPFDIFVTSGTRDPAAQVRAMYTKMDLGGREELVRLYADDAFANAVADAYPSVEDGVAVVEAYNPSAHARGLAIDLRTRDKTTAQIEAMEAAVMALGASAHLESTPPHLHIEIPSGYARTVPGISRSPGVVSGQKKSVLPVLIGLVFLAVVLRISRG